MMVGRFLWLSGIALLAMAAFLHFKIDQVPDALAFWLAAIGLLTSLVGQIVESWRRLCSLKTLEGFLQWTALAACTIAGSGLIDGKALIASVGFAIVAVILATFLSLVESVADVGKTWRRIRTKPKK